MTPRDENIQERKHRRRTVRILVDYSSPAGVQCEYATTLGAGGLFIESEEPLPRGTPLKVRFRLPGGEGVHEIDGNVGVWRGHRRTRDCLVFGPFYGAAQHPAIARTLVHAV